MRFGILYNVDYRPSIHKSSDQYYRQLLEQVQLIEELGFDSVWFGEHHYGGYSFGSPAVIATAAAASTTRIRLGTGVSLIPLHNPVQLAEEYAMLDVLSGGRLEYGVGRGFLNLGYEVFNIDQSESQERYREGLELILKVWTAQGPVSVKGKFWELSDYTFSPVPIQRPHPPIYAAASNSTESFEWAGQMGFNLCTAFFGRLEPEEVRVNTLKYRKALADAGHDPALREVAIVLQMYCAEKESELDLGVKYALNYYDFLADLFVQGGQSTGHGFLAEAKQGRLDMEKVLIGTPDQVTARVRAVQETYDPDLLVMEIAQGGTPREESDRALRLFAKHVMPQFRS